MEVSVAQMKQIEQGADARGLSYTQMMENAGRAAARLLLEQGPHPLHTAVVFCGSGNNGGDGFVLARALHEQGVQVELAAVGSAKTPDAVLNHDRALALNIREWDVQQPDEQALDFLSKADAVVDAIYGTGFHGELRPAGKQAAALMNGAAGFKLALDLPSGLEADTGRIAEGAVKADMTVTFHASKPCHRLAASQCGAVVVASIGIENLPE